jgi:NAD(P)-dependent dehydrogenase (short-subunit alcohol dehydrogenase family)
MENLTNKVILITGGSRGLGFALAKKLAEEGSVLAICARSETDLEYAKIVLIGHGARVYTSVCDVSDPTQVEAFVEAVLARFGQIDIVVNNAGVMIVGAMESFSLEDYQNAMDVMYWGIVHMTRAVLPHFKGRNEGQFVNVTSIGGVVPIPQLHPYVAAKFAAVGFSMSLAAELRKDNITVTTVIPGLMRTGSFINALFQKDNEKEFKLFSAMSTAPLITISTDKAVRGIISAMKKKKLVTVLGAPAKIIRELSHFFPSPMIRLFGFMNRFIPAREGTLYFEKGESIRRKHPHAEVRPLRKIGLKLRKNYQHAEEKSA